MEDEEFKDPPPPSADRVAKRAIVLSVVCCRGIVESHPEDPDAEDLAKRSFEWLQTLNLANDWNDWERRTLETPYGSLSARDRTNAGWLSEGLVVLAWALGKIELPSFNEQCDPRETCECLGFLQNIGETVLAQPTLRSTEELREYNEFLYNTHWRARDFSINHNSYDFRSLAKKAWGEPVLRHGLQLADDDIALMGAPLPLATEDQVRNFSSITQERHRASNWLIGYASEDFYEVTTDT
jgi:hypothetical protein